MKNSHLLKILMLEGLDHNNHVEELLHPVDTMSIKLTARVKRLAWFDLKAT